MQSSTPENPSRSRALVSQPRVIVTSVIILIFAIGIASIIGKKPTPPLFKDAKVEHIGTNDSLLGWAHIAENLHSEVLPGSDGKLTLTVRTLEIGVNYKDVSHCYSFRYLGRDRNADRYAFDFKSSGNGLAVHKEVRFDGSRIVLYENSGCRFELAS